jgi:ABC-type oligopeptide transport system ATPase subunit
VRERKPLQRVEHGKIEFKNVTFNYPTRRHKVLSSFNMEIPSGMKIGLVGHSGCGKSTITNLILRYYDLRKGSILIDGKPLSDYDVLALRDQIGYVMQEPVLFNQTIKENILFGKLDASDAKVHQVAEMANALQFIESNFEELTEAEQLDVTRKGVRDQAAALKIPELEVISKLSDLSALLISKNALEFGDPKFKELLRCNPDLFNDIVSKDLATQSTKGVKWDDLVLRFEWRHKLLQQVEAHDSLKANLTEIESLAQEFPC